MFRSLAVVLAVGTLLIAPHVALAADATFFGPIIPPECNCEPLSEENASRFPSAPDWGCVLETIQRAINLGVSLIIIVIALVLAYAGIMFIVNPTNPSHREQGRSMLINAIIGLVIVLCAWLIIDFIMKGIYNENARVGEEAAVGPWNAILGDNTTGQRCFVVNEDTPAPIEEPDEEEPVDEEPDIEPVPSGSSPAGCTDCVKVGALVPHKGPPEGCSLTGGFEGVASPNPPITSCYVNSSLYEKLKVLARTGGWQMTEMWPPTTNAHTNQCHANGTCVDAGFFGGYTEDKVTTFMTAAKAAGVRPVFETTDCSLRTKVRNAGFEAHCTDEEAYKNMTATHFSLY